MSSEPKTYWRLLEYDEVIREGDEFRESVNHAWMKACNVGGRCYAGIYRRRVTAPEPQPEQIPGMPEGWEIDPTRAVERRGVDENMLLLHIRRIQPPEPVCVWQHGVFADGWMTEAFAIKGVRLYSPDRKPYWDEKLNCFDDDRNCYLIPDVALVNPPVWRKDVPESERCVKVGPEAEAVLKGDK